MAGGSPISTPSSSLPFLNSPNPFHFAKVGQGTWREKLQVAGCKSIAVKAFTPGTRGDDGLLPKKWEQPIVNGSQVTMGATHRQWESSSQVNIPSCAPSIPSSPSSLNSLASPRPHPPSSYTLSPSQHRFPLFPSLSVAPQQRREVGDENHASGADRAQDKTQAPKWCTAELGCLPDRHGAGP